MVFLHDTVTGAETLPGTVFCPIRVGRLCRLARARLMHVLRDVLRDILRDTLRDLENDHVCLAQGRDHQSTASLFTHPV